MVFRRRQRRRQDDDPIAQLDPGQLPHRYRPAVEDALATRRRFVELVGSAAAGPMQDRLTDLSPRLDAGVTEIWTTVQRAIAVESALATLDPDRVARDLKDARRQASQGEGDPTVIDALTERFNATQRLLNTLEDLDGRLQRIDVRLEAVVARAAELVLAVGPEAASTGFDDLGADLDGALEELRALQQGFDAVSVAPDQP